MLLIQGELFVPAKITFVLLLSWFEDDIDLTSLIIQFYLKNFRPNKIIISKKINGYNELKSIMRDNYKIDVFLKSSKINGVQKISKLTAKRNDKEVNLQKQKFINNQEILTLIKNRFNINNYIFYCWLLYLFYNYGY